MKVPDAIHEFHALVQKIQSAQLREEFLQWEERSIKTLSTETVMAETAAKKGGPQFRETTDGKLQAAVLDKAKPFIAMSERPTEARAGLRYMAMRAEMWVLKS